MKGKKRFRIALVGTDSLRGKEIKEVLSRRDIHFEEIDFFDPEVEEEYSKLTRFRGEPRIIHHLDEDSLVGADLVFLASEKKINRKYGSLAGQLKFQVIDLSETFNRDKNIPLAVAGINDEEVIKERPQIIANPHPVTIILGHVFYSIQKEIGLSKAVAFILQPVSAFEESGIEELANQSVDVLNSTSLSKKVFKAQIAFNLLSYIEPMDKNGFSPTERQIITEIKRVLNSMVFPFSLAIIQAPVFHTYSIMVYLELRKKAETKALRELFKASPYFQLSAPSVASPVSCASVAGQDKIFIDQIKRDSFLPSSFWVWVVADNLTRGSALNALEIAKKIIQS